ncbi:MAG TPA: helix-turn-helix transcriptional regulator [Prolixibacteraceae bacterium]|nr:helix-turn-helix transcriptional regulator [Prolixibacteraceae bacterium]
MEDRIKKFIDYMGITASELADSIGVQRSNVTHVLKGRNKPSFQFIEKLLQIYPSINAKWLLLGEGNMLESPAKPPTLFDSVPTPPVQPKPVEKVEREAVKEAPPVHEEPAPSPVIKERKEPENDLPGAFLGSEKPIERLIVFYNDQTFKVYNPSR